MHAHLDAAEVVGVDLLVGGADHEPARGSGRSLPAPQRRSDRDLQRLRHELVAVAPLRVLGRLGLDLREVAAMHDLDEDVLAVELRVGMMRDVDDRARG